MGRSVLISGASIAGPALAYWLDRYGFEVTVVERAAQPRPGGHAVDVRGTAKAVAERMGIMPAIRGLLVHERGLAYVDRRGRHVATLPAELFGGEAIVAEIEILRGDLSRVLIDATGDRVSYVYGDRITELSEGEDGVKVSFERGEPRRFDLVVAADGVHSGVRALAFGDESNYVRYLGAYTAFFTAPPRTEVDGWFLLYNAPGGRVVGLRPGREPDTKVMLSFTSPSLAYDRRDPAGQQAILAKALAGAGWLTDWALAAMRESTDFYFDQIAQVHTAELSRGRVVLLGDAGYSPSPLTGLGTSLALVGAYVLAGELASTSDHRLALTRYAKEMEEFIRVSRQLPPGGVRGYAPGSRFAIAMRNRSMAMLGLAPIRRLMAKQANKSSVLALPEYPRA